MEFASMFSYGFGVHAQFFYKIFESQRVIFISQETCDHSHSVSVREDFNGSGNFAHLTVHVLEFTVKLGPLGVVG
jgi:hypothetical protein